MNVSYTGMKQDLPQKLQTKLDSKFAKLSKFAEKRGPKEAHVMITKERHLLKAEVTMRFYGHPMVGVASDTDLFTAIEGALDKLEKQVTKDSAKWRDKTRRSEAPPIAEPPAPKPAAKQKAVSRPKLAGVIAGSNGRDAVAQRIFRVDHSRGQKPMTLDEAVLEMENDQEYLVYHDADRESLSVLVRRRDGHFDLIES